MNKISMLWFVLGLFAGLLLTAHRRHLATPWPWLAAGLAGLIFLPHLLWQAQTGWPTREFIRNATTEKMTEVSPLGFILTQVLVMNPFAAPVWIAGLLSSLLSRQGRGWQILAWIWLTTALVLILSGTSRANYLAPAYPMLLAPGAVALERFTRARGRRWLRATALAAVLIGGLIILPMAVPVLPVEQFIAYARAVGVEGPREEKGERGALPQHYADMFGWPELAATVAAAYHRLLPEDRSRCAIYTQNYGEAGAIDFFGRRHGLPQAISGHNNYWLWGPRGWTGEVILIVGGKLEDHRRSLRDVQQVGTAGTPYSQPYEQDLPIYLGRGLRMPVEQLWPRVKKYR